MAKILLTISLLLSLYFQTAAQSWTMPIIGAVTNMDIEPLPGIEVVLFENDRSLDTTYTDSTGSYDLQFQFVTSNSYSLLVQCHESDIDHIIIHKAHDTIKMSSYVIDVSCYEWRYEKFDNSAYFEYNDIDNVMNFEAEWIKSLLEEYPGMCIEFKQSINPKEKLRIAQERMGLKKF